jgi:hypothetical protein
VASRIMALPADAFVPFMDAFALRQLHDCLDRVRPGIVDWNPIFSASELHVNRLPRRNTLQPVSVTIDNEDAPRAL